MRKCRSNQLAHQVFLESIAETPKTEPRAVPEKPVDLTKNPRTLSRWDASED
jgi:hypothetical protein